MQVELMFQCFQYMLTIVKLSVLPFWNSDGLFNIQNFVAYQIITIIFPIRWIGIACALPTPSVHLMSTGGKNWKEPIS